MVMAPQYTLVSLQTSIGVKDALGSMGMMVYELVCVVTILMYVPMFLWFGRKNCLLVGAIPSVLFTLSMMYPTMWTVTPAEILLGIAESVEMTAIGAIVSSVVLDSEHDSEKKRSSVGVYLTIMAVGEAITCLVAELVLKDSGAGWFTSIFSHKEHVMANISRCGANDCPMDYSFKENSHVFRNLIPTVLSRCVYLGALAVTQIIGIIILWRSVPYDNMESQSRDIDERQHLLLGQFRSAWTQFKTVFRRLVVHMSSKISMLTIPLQMQYGVFCGFLWAEVGRSYVSCTIGIEHLGFFQFVAYIVTLICTYFLHRFRSSISNPAVFLLSYVVEISFFLCALLWQPSSSSLYMLCVLGVTVGAANAFRKITSYFIASIYSNDLDSSYAVRTAFVALGVAVVNSWVTIFCIYTKIYIIVAWLTISTVLALIAHYRFADA